MMKGEMISLKGLKYSKMFLVQEDILKPFSDSLHHHSVQKASDHGVITAVISWGQSRLSRFIDL